MRKKTIRIEIERPREFEEVVEVEAIKDQIIKHMKKIKKPVRSSVIAKAFNRGQRQALQILTDMEREGLLKSRMARIQVGSNYYNSRLFELP